MDWLRRNWPDLLIGMALVAVIAGIVATLLTGGSFLSTGQSRTADTPPNQEQDAGASSAAAVSGAPEDEGGDERTRQADADEGPRVAVLPPSEEDEAPPAAADTPAEADAEDTAPEADEAEETSSTEDPGSVEPLDPDAEAEGGEDAAPSSGADEPAPAAAAAEDAAATEAGPAGDVPVEPFRVSVGAFSSRSNAERQAERFRDAGYPVFVGAQDALSLVLVGPFEQRGRADEVAGRIEADFDDVDPVIYRYEPDGEAVQASADPASAAARDDEVSAAASAEDVEAPPSASESAADAVSLQVGAYATPDSAEPLVERLESLGFAATRQRDGGLIRVLVGPFAGEALEDARTTLDAADVDYFAR